MAFLYKNKTQKSCKKSSLGNYFIVEDAERLEKEISKVTALGNFTGQYIMFSLILFAFFFFFFP